VSAAADQTGTPGAWTPHLAVNDTGTGPGGASHITGMQLAPGTSDSAGNVYVAYPESVNDYPNYDGAAIKVVHASSSALDHWSTPSVVAASGGAGNILPHVIAGGPGQVDVAYYHGVKTGSKIAWYSTAAQSLNALSSSAQWTTVQLSGVVVEPSQSASELMGACMQGQQATLNGFVCGRAADVYGIALDRCGGLVTTWPAQANLKSDGTYVSQQIGGPTLGTCMSATKTKARRASSGSGAVAGPGLAATGSSRWLPLAGLLLLSAAVVVRRRRSS
jgi:LPXTG-motif cell wall-anchored protein